MMSSFFLLVVLVAVLAQGVSASWFDNVENFFKGMVGIRTPATEVEEEGFYDAGVSYGGQVLSTTPYGTTTLFTTATALFNYAGTSNSKNTIGPKSGDILVLKNGIYYETAPMDFSGGCGAQSAASTTGGGWCLGFLKNVTIKAQTPGGVIWQAPYPGIFINIMSGSSYVTFTGFQFRHTVSTLYGPIINSQGSYNTISNLYFFNVSASHYIRLVAGAQYNLITNCNFEYKPSYGPCPTTYTSPYCNKGNTWYSGNLVAVEATPLYPGYHKIRYCSFYNMAGSPLTGAGAKTVSSDFGDENIRIGEDSMHTYISRTIVEYCVFNSTYGVDSEAVSIKSRQNIIRYSTFGNNMGAMLSVRNGDLNVIYSNFFINAGGVRVKHANNTYVYNNYFQNSGDNIRSWPIAWFNLSGVWGPYYSWRNNFVITHNTFVECGYTNFDTTPKIGGMMANNIFKKTPNVNPLVPSGNIFWGNSQGIEFKNNMYYGTLSSNTPYSQGCTGKNGPPNDCYCDPKSATCDTVPNGPSSASMFINADPVMVFDSTLGYYIPNMQTASPFIANLPNSPAIGKAIKMSDLNIANFDIPVLDDDPLITKDITGRTRPASNGMIDMGAFQSGTFGVIQNVPINVFNTGVSYASSIINKPTSYPTVKPTFGSPSFTPTVAPSKPTKAPTGTPTIKSGGNAAHKEGEKVKEHGSPEEAPAPDQPVLGVVTGVDSTTGDVKAVDTTTDKDILVAPVKGAKTVVAKKTNILESAVDKVKSAVSNVKNMVTEEKAAPAALRASKFDVETASSPTKSPSSGIHKPTWKPSSKPNEHRV